MRKMRKLISCIAAMALCISLIPVSLQATKTTAQAEAEGEGELVELDLSKFDVQVQENGKPEYDETTKTLKAVNVEQFIVTLPRRVNKGETILVTINGKNNGTVGLRFWLSDKNYGEQSAQYHSKDYETFGSGDFTISEDLTSTGAATELLIKGPSWGTYLDDIEFSSITVKYGAESSAREPDNPFAPEAEQVFDTADLTLTTSFRDRNSVSKESVNSLLVAQRFIADPTTIEYNGRLYVYGTTDEIEFDKYGNVIENVYNTHTLSCLSTDDMVNWKDEGKIDVTKLTTYAQKSWAPSIVSKEINGKTKFFIYYTTGGDGIGVLEADHPTGPWKDPLGKRIIDRSLPTCSEAEVPWLFDPGVFVDDDGKAYIYFGGGSAGTSSGRVCKLNDDMISLDVDTMKPLDPKFYFEDNEINKIGDTYYYSYCTNWSGRDDNTTTNSIAYYTADNPYMENWEYHGTVFPNPGNAYGKVYNNHHHMFTFKDKYYISYHTTYLEWAQYGTKQGYRSLHIDKLNVASDGTLSAETSYAGVGGEGNINAQALNDANIMSDNGGLTTEYSDNQSKMVLTQIHTGDWNKVTGADFGSDAKNVQITLSSQTDEGSIEIYIDGKPGDANAVKVATVPLKKTSGNDIYENVEVPLTQTISGKHDLYFVYRGTGYQVASWAFYNDVAPTPGPTATPTPPAPPTATPPATQTPGTTEKTYQVTMITGIGEPHVYTVKAGEKAYPLTGGPRRAGYEFLGWYNGNVKYNFDTPVQSNLTLTAKWKKVTVKKASISKAKKKGKKVTITVKKVAGAAGYQVKAGSNKKVTKNKKTLSSKKTKLVIKKWKKKNCYVKVRAYKLDSTGKRVYGKWSKAKKAK